MTNFLKKNDLDVFIMVSINQIISKLEVKKNNEDYSHFSKIRELLFNNYNNNLKQLLFLFFNENQFNNIIKPKLKEREKNLISLMIIHSKVYYMDSVFVSKP